ncbi:MAG: hypothetical protein LBH86_03195 [Oscillospiraceae bacterium]|jgi:hypothetical protein|nr:hypothetical protein [Oscillospiraceae bacterium]
MSEALVLNPTFGLEALSDDELFAVDGGFDLEAFTRGALQLVAASVALVAGSIALATPESTWTTAPGALEEIGVALVNYGISNLGQGTLKLRASFNFL